MGSLPPMSLALRLCMCVCVCVRPDSASAAPNASQTADQAKLNMHSSYSGKSLSMI